MTERTHICRDDQLLIQFQADEDVFVAEAKDEPSVRPADSQMEIDAILVNKTETENKPGDFQLQSVAEFQNVYENHLFKEQNVDVAAADDMIQTNNIPKRDERPGRKDSAPCDFSLLLASTYINEALYGRNGYFIPEQKQLDIYSWYNNGAVRLCLFILISINMMLVLFEEPAVSDWALPYWVTMLIEMICLIGYFGRLVHAWAFMPKWRHWKDRKVIIILACLLMTLIDMVIYIILEQTGFKKYAVRWSRVLRPAFMVNFSESRQIRRAFRNIRRILPEIANVLVLLMLVMSLYALLGLKFFQKRDLKTTDGQPYFHDYFDVFFALYVLTTTANNPDITIPAYNANNWYCLYFLVFIIVCMYIFVSIFLAVVYKNYRKHLKNEVKAVVYRKRRNLHSAFACIRTKRDGKCVLTFERWRTLMHYMAPKISPVHLMLIWHVLDENNTNSLEFSQFVHIPDLLSVKMKEMTQRPQFFERISPNFYNSKVIKFMRKCVLHRFFVYFFDLIIVSNAICIGFDVETFEIPFLVIFNLENILKMYTFGFQKFFSRFWNIFDFIVIGSATLILIFESFFEPFQHSERTVDVLMILRVLRLFKVIGNYQRFKVIINTIMQIGPAIITYGGIMFIFYYVYAIIGMEFFAGKVKDAVFVSSSNNSESFISYCGNDKLKDSEYYRLQYCGKNFNNVLKSFNLLFDLTVVNQWHVIADGFVRVTSKAARLYFLSFHMLCVIVILNIFVAFVLEAFMLQYSFSKTKYEDALEKKIEEKGAGPHIDETCDTSSENPLDENFSITNYVSKTRVSYKLKKRKTKDAMEILQHMFEDELLDDDLGPNLKDLDDLDDAIELEQDEKSRSLTLNNVDAPL